MSAQAQGWYRDPFGIHDDRYFSEGRPTKLVRDHGEEAYDPPPDLPLPDEPLVPLDDETGEEAGYGSDLRRADQTARGGRRSAESAARSVLDVFDQTAGEW